MSNGSRTPQIRVTLFGKHPAWADHIEDIGSSSPLMGAFKGWLYNEGIRANLDSGAWERLADADRIADWDHRLVSMGNSGVIAARLWASSDGKGRRAYPMVAAVHLPTTRLPEDIAPLFAALDGVRDRCALAATQEGLREAAALSNGDIAAAIEVMRRTPPVASPEESRQQFLDYPGMGPQRVGFERLIHVMTSDLLSLSPSASAKRRKKARPRAFRVPVPAEGSGRFFPLWHRFFLPHLALDTMITLVQPSGESWVDLIAGNPDADTVFRFRALTATIPCLSDIAYNVPPETVERTKSILLEFTTLPFNVTSLHATPAQSGATGLIGSLVRRIFRNE